MSVFLLCEQAIGLVRGKRLILSTSERSMLEALNYEGLTAAHAQDEAVVCALHFARVRDRLLQLYAWQFAKKTATVAAGGTLPSDFLSMMYVLVSGEPVDYEVVGSTLRVKSSAEIHYIAKITDTSKWDVAFTDVFCYSLAVEICSAVTGRPEYTQVLEQKAQELIHRAIQIGAIKADTHLTLTQEIYNRAIHLARGQRTVSPTSTATTEQGIDIAGFPNERTQEEIQACKRAADSVRDRLLQLHAWEFAKKSVRLSTAVTVVDGWSYGYSLPSDCLKVLTALSSGEPVDFEVVGSSLYSKVATPTIRYVARVTDMNSWVGAFTDVFVAELAQEVILATTHNLEAIQLLEQKAQIMLRNAEKIGAIRAEVKIPVTHEIYQRAISLVRGQRIISPTGNTAAEQGIDFIADINFREREALAVCRQSLNTLQAKLLKLYAWKFARKTATLTATTKISGWSYAYRLPTDCLKVLVVLSNDEPIEYEETDGVILCNSTGTITARYTRSITDLAGLDAIFKEVLCYELAEEISSSLTWNAEQITVLEQKKQALIQEAYRTGLIQEETKIPLKEVLYQRAIMLSKGERTLKTTGATATQQGIDNAGFFNDREVEAIAICKNSSSYVRDRVLQLYAWTFARKTATLETSTAISGWAYGYTLPSDCLTVLTALSNGEPVDFEVVGGKLYSNGAGVEVRYTARISDMTQWPSSFANVFCYELAQEVISGTTANPEQIALLEQKKQTLVAEAYKIGAIKIETRIPVKQELFNRAIGLVKGKKTEQPDFMDNRYEDEISACKRSFNSLRDRLLQSYAWTFARKTTTPPRLSESVPGWRYTYLLPADCLKVVAVISPDRRKKFVFSCDCISGTELSENVELTDYETTQTELYTNSEVVFVRYTAKSENTEEWASSFMDALVILMAIEVALNVTDDKQLVQLLEQRLQKIIDEAKANKDINDTTGLPKQKQTRVSMAREVPYMDYSGIPTLPCSPFDYCGGCVR